MFNTLKKRLALYNKVVAEVRLQEERQKQYNALVGQELSYPIIRDLINSAANGVEITLTFKDGTKMDIHKADKMQDDPYRNELF